MTLPPRLRAMGRTLESRIAPPIYRRTPIVTLSESSKRELVEELGFRDAARPVVPPGIDARFSPGDAKSADPARRRGGTARPGQALRAADRGARRAQAGSIPDLEAVIVGEGYRRDQLEAQIHESGRRAVDPPRPAALTDERARGPVPPGLAVGERGGARGLGDDDHGGRRVRDAGGGHPHRRPHRTHRGRKAVPACWSTDRDELRDAHEPSCSPITQRRARLTAGARRARESGSPGPRPLAARSRSSPPRRCSGADARRDDGRPEPGDESPRVRCNDDPAGPPVPPRTRRGIGYSRLAALAYVPLLLTAPGKVAADTKQYLYLDPASAPGAGVVHVGPEHRVRHGHPPEHRLPVPDGSVLLVARPRGRARLDCATHLARAASCSSPGSECSTCFRTLGLRGPGAVVARARATC